jgi:hypothetical protein
MPWNRAFKGRPVVVPPDGALPRVRLADGGTLTLLSPTWEELGRLRTMWKDHMKMAGPMPGSSAGKRPDAEEEEDDVLESASAEPRTARRMRQEPRLRPESIDVEALAHSPFRDDRSVPNGSSIAFLAEIEGRSLLIGGDAFDRVLVKSIRRLLLERGAQNDVLRVSLFVVPHFGSRTSASKELLELIACDRYVFATSGERYGNPDPETVARVITFGGARSGAPTTLIFNYRSAVNSVWGDKKLQERYRYTAIYPESGSAGVRIRL